MFLSHRMLLVDDTAAWGLVVATLVWLATWYWWQFRLLRWVRAWRRRMEGQADRRFRLRLLTAGERTCLIGRRGLTSEQWFRMVADEYAAGRRAAWPTVGDYLAEFGRRPRIRTAPWWRRKQRV